MLNKYEIWMEGFCTNEEKGTADFLGIYEGNTFQEACKKAADDNGYSGLYDSERNVIWGCGLYDNEKDARKSFG